MWMYYAMMFQCFQEIKLAWNNFIIKGKQSLIFTDEDIAAESVHFHDSINKYIFKMFDFFLYIYIKNILIVIKYWNIENVIQISVKWK